MGGHLTRPDQTFLYRHQFLHMVWVGLPSFLTTLTYNQQRALHDYYLPTQPLTDEQLLVHRAKMAKRWPALASMGGKAFRQLERTYLEVTRAADGDPDRLRVLLRSRVHYTVGAPNKKGRRILVTGLARPEVDNKRFARAVVDLARQIAAEERVAKDEAKTQDLAA